MKRTGFTIIELLMVISIIAVLTTIVTTAAANAMRSSREKRTEATRVALQAAIATYHAQDTDEKWPGAIENLAESGKTDVLSESQAQEVFQIVVKKSVQANGVRLIDPSPLFVAPSGARDGVSGGLSFADAVKGGPHRRKLNVSQLVFGYPGKITGKFHRFNIIYNAATDSVKVSTCCHECCGVNGCTKNGSGNRTPCPVCHGSEQ